MPRTHVPLPSALTPSARAEDTLEGTASATWMPGCKSCVCPIPERVIVGELFGLWEPPSPNLQNEDKTLSPLQGYGGSNCTSSGEEPCELSRTPEGGFTCYPVRVALRNPELQALKSLFKKHQTKPNLRLTMCAHCGGPRGLSVFSLFSIRAPGSWTAQALGRGSGS